MRLEARFYCCKCYLNYDYQRTVGPDGKPRIKEFGNVKPAAKGLVEQTGVRQPLVVNVLDEKENILRITAEMPGVHKEDIKLKLNVTDQYVIIHAERGDKKYHVDIPVSVDLNHLQKHHIQMGYWSSKSK
jgi:HSP20 family protein